MSPSRRVPPAGVAAEGGAEAAEAGEAEEEGEGAEAQRARVAAVLRWQPSVQPRGRPVSVRASFRPRHVRLLCSPGVA
ncbi:hypothetical protein [Sphingomonas floccifaciens]|uniref:hypothetical protein n=1 Tax=Sphingomonas floccifaciens TaxID=1844115 RepID=UPI0036D40A0D